MYDKINHAFLMQRINAKRRKIEFQFTFDEWVAWWEQQLGSNWFKLRGKKPGQYQMARHKDSGPYAPQNVMCLSIEDNVSQMVYRRRGKLTEDQVKEIRAFSAIRSSLAAKFGVSESTIWNIQMRKSYKQY